MCLVCSQSAILYTDLDKLKVSVSVFNGSVVSTSLCVCVGGLVGLGDNYSRDHLFSGMRYSNKRLREREEVRWKRRESRTEVWRTTRQADSISLTALID